MITTRSWLPDLFTAAWTERNLHRLRSARLILVIRLACFFEYLVVGWLGRRLKPFVRALLIDFSARSSERFWHTTCTSPGPLPVTADASERAWGTPPPAGVVMEVSGAGSGQYDGRSRCAAASAGSPRKSAMATTTSPNRFLIQSPQLVARRARVLVGENRGVGVELV